MKHLIIGSGTVGKATGYFLEANNEEVYYNDIDNAVLSGLKEKGKKVSEKVEDLYDVFWVCTHEKHVIKVVNDNLSIFKNNVLIIRSTTPVGLLDSIIEEHNLDLVAHNPEFLREKTAVEDSFNPDRIVIGTYNGVVSDILEEIYTSLNVPKIVCLPTESELIKYTSNCWLATQISFWNEVKELYDKLGINGQGIANAVCLDRRISRYGSNMLGDCYKGMCLPKDMANLIKVFKEKGIDPIVLNAVEERNKCAQQKKGLKME